ncbi:MULTISPECIES: GAF and ANTAR domain-containing protein [Streptomyces]|uniref:GAF and ANTAR domain-containing protein n=2 Tax=Streptomyces rimosus subsp. rimosus TaxID=132474 RepID=L8EX50_STRR1|nr:MULTISPECIES: GAF and ANTAR domain-containing protein [Streptomyces]MYT47784.1 ANTAR domain-containing protein [Streptomyces sp. SID5471]KEF19124.1 RNA-binding protein [Streptomyces rimosus]KUJ31585.1 RNA-binding protein [Streptomyces rimosus subsp. rimosus]QDA05690.1 ANTAR domain-containing protein [Streptomyces rimosus]QDA06785.1 ANTAR domain-containing protein [Streptomyces rimosus]
MTSSPFPPPDDPSSSNGPPRLPREARITAALIDLADTLVDDFDPAEFLYRVAEHCMDLLDIGDAGVMLAVPGGPLRLVAASSERVRLVELFELDAAEGPCCTAFDKAVPVDHTFTASPSPRWPRFSARAHRAGYTSVHATPIRLRRDTLGVLNLFRRTPGPLLEADRHLARALADATAISLLQQTTLDEHRTVRAQLEKALDTRTVIEQAKGFLTARHETDPDTAFHRLRAHARHHHLRLVDLARDIVDGTTTLPPPDTDKAPTLP